MTETYKAWRISPSGKAEEVEIEIGQARGLGGWVCSTKGKWFDPKKLHANRQEAVAAGIQIVDAEIARNARQHERLLRKRDTLLKAR